jgi:hypothetical protein
MNSCCASLLSCLFLHPCALLTWAHSLHSLDCHNLFLLELAHSFPCCRLSWLMLPTISLPVDVFQNFLSP